MSQLKINEVAYVQPDALRFGIEGTVWINTEAIVCTNNTSGYCVRIMRTRKCFGVDGKDLKQNQIPGVHKRSNLKESKYVQCVIVTIISDP